MSNRSGSTITLPASHAVIAPATNGVHVAESLTEPQIPEHVAVIMDGMDNALPAPTSAGPESANVTAAGTRHSRRD